MRTKMILAALLAAPMLPAEAATTIFVDTPSSMYTLRWCEISDIHILRHGTTSDGWADCKQAVAEAQVTGWNPEPHPDGLVPLWESSFRLNPVGSFTQCELIDYRRGPENEMLVIQCVSDPIPLFRER